MNQQPIRPSLPSPSSRPRIAGPSERASRIALGIGVPALFLTLASVPFLMVRSDLADRVATHFDLSGTPDGSMSVTSFLLATGALLAIGLLLCAGTAIRRPTEGGVATTTGFLGGFLGTLGASILASTAVTQRGLDDWSDAGSAGWTLGFALVSATAVGAFGSWLASHLTTAGPPSPEPGAPIMDLSDGESAVWIARLRSTPLLALGLTVGAAGLVLIGTANWFVGALVTMSSIPLTALATLHVRVDRTGLRVKYGWLPRPTTHISVDDIDTAQAIDVRPLEWGGWGYRGSLKLMRKAAVVHRAGPGIRLDLTDGKVFVVTIDDPDTGVALLNALLQRRAVVSPPLR